MKIHNIQNTQTDVFQWIFQKIDFNTEHLCLHEKLKKKLST